MSVLFAYRMRNGKIEPKHWVCVEVLDVEDHRHQKQFTIRCHVGQRVNINNLIRNIPDSNLSDILSFSVRCHMCFPT